MKEAEAYTDKRNLKERSLEKYISGDVVCVGMARYRNGTYYPDGKEGTYIVVTESLSGFYRLIRWCLTNESKHVINDSYIITSSRLQYLYNKKNPRKHIWQ